MRILFIARHFTYFRNYDSVIVALAERGHRVHLAAERGEELGGRELVERLAAAHDGVSIGWIPDREDRWSTFVTKLRLTIDYLRYLDTAYDSTPRLRARARERVPRAGVILAGMAARTRSGRRLLEQLLRTAERAVPRSLRIDAYLRDEQPDVVLLTPLIGVVASPQLDYLQSAKAAGIPTALCVWSWDHLSSKAIVRNVPDRVFVWNDTQRREAVILHGVPEDRIVVTGAQCFDRWFARTPSTSRAAFCRKTGLPEDRPFLLYVCSALFRGTGPEALFVRQWLRALRSSGLDPLSTTPVLIRPHPARMKEWEDVDLTAERDAVLWGRNPVDAEARTDYFDSLHHSAAVVGLNTSAFLEAAVAERPIYAPLLPEHYENQEGTIHFHYLLTVGGGLLYTARSLEDHCAQLNDALARPPDRQRSRRFVEAFIRPHGLETAATPIVADAVEQLASQPGAPPAAEPAFVRLLRRVLWPLATVAVSDVAWPLVSSERERLIAARQQMARAGAERAAREKMARKVAAQKEKEARAAARRRHKAERVAEWRRLKTNKKATRRLKSRIGLGR